MNYYDGKIELEREVAALNAALAAERADCARAKESLDERCKTIIEQRTRIDFLDPYCKRLEEELAAEREKVVALEAENEGLLKLDVRTLNAVVGRLEATVGSPAAVRILAMSFAAFLRENKGENFCTVDCVDSSDPENPVAMSVTVARKGGKSTAEVLAELRAERDALSDRVRGLEGALQPLVPNQHGDYGGPLVAGKWWFEDGSEQVISSDNGIKAANALTPPAPAGPVTLKPGHDHDDNDPYMPAPAKAAGEGENA